VRRVENSKGESSWPCNSQVTLSEQSLVPVFFRYLLVNAVMALVAFSSATSFSSEVICFDFSNNCDPVSDDPTL